MIIAIVGKGATMKKCSMCKEIKPLVEFHKSRSNTDGRQYYCKVCMVESYGKESTKLKRLEKRIDNLENAIIKLGLIVKGLQ